MKLNDATAEYRTARKQGLKRYHDDLKKGVSPYPKVLDELIADRKIAGRVELGLFEIPIDRIVGTANAGRRTAFSADFMPLLEENTEFGMKWISLCNDHLGDTGIRDPIRCYEYRGDFYIQEGNKRVSVLKYFGAATVMASVLRIVPAWSEDEATRVYYEFLDYFHKSKLYAIRFDQPGRYARFVAALGFTRDHVWTPEERQAVQSLYLRFSHEAEAASLKGTTLSDAFLHFLSVYSIDDARAMSAEEIRAAITASAAETEASVSVETQIVAPEKSVLDRIVDAVLLPDDIQAAFLYEYDPEESDWIAAHEAGRKYAEEKLGNQVKTKTYRITPETDANACFKEAVEDGATVIFATTPSLIAACRKAAVAYPQIKILNCSVIMPFPGVRTYYSRIYEAKFISGAIAGAMTKTDRIGYIASSPTFGVPAGINAFALGARMTNPRARIDLHWSCSEEDPMAALIREGVDVVSNRDLPIPSQPQDHWGLNQIAPDGSLHALAAPFWNWGEIYVRLLMDILQGHWVDSTFRSTAQAVNYWLGMQSGAVDLVFAEDLPEGVRTLADLLKGELSKESLFPFFRRIVSQDGILRSDGTRLFSPEEILRMDWLCDAVDGEIPPFEKILPMSQNIVRLEGIYRDTLPPEKVDVTL
ncbi:MAG: BMP family ABC transporter substrate-binding protein [Clostridia bacterium]|nr:BMP family ABC transporter substrate-binding protein [Clostridia bacterium]